MEEKTYQQAMQCSLSFICFILSSFLLHADYLASLRYIRSIDRTTFNLIWRGPNSKGIHLVGWKKIATPRHLGGLGIRSARETNIYLIGKLVWEMVQSPNKLQAHLQSHKYTVDPRYLHASYRPEHQLPYLVLNHSC